MGKYKKTGKKPGPQKKPEGEQLVQIWVSVKRRNLGAAKPALERLAKKYRA